MIPDFKGHHFVKDSKLGGPILGHHCDQCGLKASLRPDGWMDFHREDKGILVAVSGETMLADSPVPSCK